MTDLFISYSRKDSEQALQLVDILRSTGLSVWIDTHGIEAASSWSAEIVDAIDGAKAVIVLLSSASIVSFNVMKEVSLAGERGKKLFPIDLEPVTLPREFAYHLAGLQRSSMANIDGIMRVLARMGLEATGSPIAPAIVKESDPRKSLMILPFEDLSPTGDNAWFADGIVSETISLLSRIPSLRLIDWNTAREFKGRKLQTSALARELGVRYFIEGAVRKFGDQIKITAQLLDINEGEYLWQIAERGSMGDVFEIQEAFAQRVVDGFKLQLTVEERSILKERGTENEEAYELYLKARIVFTNAGLEVYEHAVRLLESALDLDPLYAEAMAELAHVHSEIYRVYDRDPARLAKCESLALEARSIKPKLAKISRSMMRIHIARKEIALAEAESRLAVENEPDNANAHATLGFFYMEHGRYDEAIGPFRESLRLIPNNRSSLINLLICYDGAKMYNERKSAAIDAIEVLKKHARLFPDDGSDRIWIGNFLLFADKKDEAREYFRTMAPLKDAMDIYNLACAYYEMEEFQLCATTLLAAAEAGFAVVESIERGSFGGADALPEFVTAVARIRENSGGKRATISA